MPAFPSDAAMRILEADLGPVADVFSEISPSPVAAASLGQVPPHSMDVMDRVPM